MRIVSVNDGRIGRRRCRCIRMRRTMRCKDLQVYSMRLLAVWLGFRPAALDITGGELFERHCSLLVYTPELSFSILK
jgi:hypothetical protein